MGIHTGELTRMVRRGTLERIGPGRYRRPSGGHGGEHQDLVLAAHAVPGAAVCLLSALQFHGIGTQLPHQVWLAVPRGTRVPKLAEPPLRIVNIAPDLFELGLESHRIGGATVRVYTAARSYRGLLSIPESCWPRRRARGAIGRLAREAIHHGRTHEDRQATSRAAHHATVSGSDCPMTRPPRNIVASVQARLVQRSHELHVEHQLTLARFTGERLAYRLSAPHADRFIVRRGAPAGEGASPAERGGA